MARQEGERGERRRWRSKRPERVAAVDEQRRRSRRGDHRAPQQDTTQILSRRCRLGFNWHARRDSLHHGVARSSPREQQSTGLLHLNGSSPIGLLRTCNFRGTPNLRNKTGTPGGTRTPDLLLRRQLLYPAELLAHLNGAGDGNRTRVSSLEGWCSTIELHPRILSSLFQP